LSRVSHRRNVADTTSASRTVVCSTQMQTVASAPVRNGAVGGQQPQQPSVGRHRVHSPSERRYCNRKKHGTLAPLPWRLPQLATGPARVAYPGCVDVCLLHVAAHASKCVLLLGVPVHPDLPLGAASCLTPSQHIHQRRLASTCRQAHMKIVGMLNPGVLQHRRVQARQCAEGKLLMSYQGNQLEHENITITLGESDSAATHACGSKSQAWLRT
jgi:hypothetical protein